MAKLTNKHENEKVKLDVIELYELENKFKEIKQKYDKKKQSLVVNIKNFMFVNDDINYLKFLAQSGDCFSKDNKQIEVKKISPVSITWDADKLSEKLDKELALQVVEKTYEVNDMDKLVKYLKSFGVDAKTFKKYITVKKSVKVDELKQLEELGELSFSDVKGCYSTKQSAAYLKINILEDE